jgi:hypothetical protein
MDEDELKDLNEDARQDNPNQHLQQDEAAKDNQDKDDNEDEGTALISKPALDSQGSKKEGLQEQANQYRNSNQT